MGSAKNDPVNSSDPLPPCLSRQVSCVEAPTFSWWRRSDLAHQVSVVEISRSPRPEYRCEPGTTSLETSLGRIMRICLVIWLATQRRRRLTK